MLGVLTLGHSERSQNPTTHAVTLRAHEGTLSATVSTRTVRSPACAGGCGAAMAVVPVPLSAAGESAARKGNARMSSIGHSDRLSGVTLEWVVTWNTVRIWATLGHSASGYPSRPEYPTRHGRDAHPTYMVSPRSMHGVPHSYGRR